MTALVIAHRTCPRDAAENSLAGIRHAATTGAEVVEVDVRLTADGEPVLMHDQSLWRMTRRARRLDRTTLEELLKLRLRRTSERVPTLAEAFDALGAKLSVALDVKDPAAADAVLSEIRNQRLEGRVKFWAKSTAAVAQAVARSPEIESSLLRDATTAGEIRHFLDDAGTSGARGISAHWSVITPSFVETCRSRRLTVYAWCKTRQIDSSKVALLDGLVTDWPVTARALIDTR